jgi:hypothetical protein
MDDPAPAEGAADPARAFEDLRAEVSVLRRAVEALPAAWADNQPPDYSPDLGRIAKGLGEVAGHLQGIERHPALLATPEAHQQAVAHAGEAVMAGALRKLDLAAQGADRERHQLASLIGAARTKEGQFRALVMAAAISLVAGLVLSPIVAGGLPFGLNARVAALVMRDNRWHAGEVLMQAQSLERWQALEAAGRLVQANQEVLATCEADAARVEKPMRCTISVGEAPRFSISHK